MNKRKEFKTKLQRSLKSAHKPKSPFPVLQYFPERRKVPNLCSLSFLANPDNAGTNMLAAECNIITYGKQLIAVDKSIAFHFGDV